MGKISLSALKNKHFLAFTGNAVIAVFGVLTIALLTRSLTKADVGAWFYFLGIYTLGDAVRSGFLGTATIKFYAGTTAERAEKVLGSVWYLAIIITAILSVADLGFICFLNQVRIPALAVSIQWFGATFISSLPFNLIFWILVADEKYDKVLWLRLINSGSMILYIIVLIFIHQMTLQALLWCNFLTNCLTSLAGLAWGMGKVKTIFKRTRESTLEIIHFGKFSLGSTFVSKLLGNSDTFIITAMLGAPALAVYSMAAKLMEIVEFPLRSFVGTGMSAMAVAYNQGNLHQTSYILKKYSGMLTIAFIPLSVFAFFFADIAIRLLGGAQYTLTEAPNIYRLLMILCLFYPADRFIGVTLDIIHKPKINFYKVIIMLAVVICGDFTGILIFKNLYGIVFASFLTLLAGSSFGYFQLIRYLRFSYADIFILGFHEMKVFLNKKLRPGKPGN